jgi:hypothetical protein
MRRRARVPQILGTLLAISLLMVSRLQNPAESSSSGCNGASQDEVIGYEVSYFISCAEAKFAVVSGSSLLAYAQEATSRRKLTNVPQNQLMAWGLSRLAHGGWEVIQFTGEDYVMKGYGTLATMTERKYRK